MVMPILSTHLILDSCPHCGRSNPTLKLGQPCFSTQDHTGVRDRWWGVYICTSCGGIVTAGALKVNDRPTTATTSEVYPSPPTVSDSIPDKPHGYLRQAQSSFHAPDGAIMLCASAVDAMLKEKRYIEGSLYKRIDQAATDHLITDTMAQWAHQIRLDANEQRHADEDVGPSTYEDAKLTFDFAIAFAEYLFVLPSKVNRGIAETKSAQKLT